MITEQAVFNIKGVTAVLNTSSCYLSFGFSAQSCQHVDTFMISACLMQSMHPKKTERRLSTEDYCVMQVSLSIPSVCIRTHNLVSNGGQLTGSLENRNFQLHASRQPPQLPVADTSADPTGNTPPGNSDVAAQQLYWMRIASGGSHVGLGMTDAVPAVTASVNAFSTELALTKPFSLPAGQGVAGQQHQEHSALVHASLTFHDPSAHCCYDTLWHLVAAIQQQQQMLRASLPAENTQMSTAASPSDAVLLAECAPTSDSSESDGMTAAEGSLPGDTLSKASASSIEPQQNSTPGSQNGNNEQLLEVQQTASEQHHPIIALQCILQAQTAGLATLDVVSGDGVAQATCSTDVMSASVTVKPGNTAGCVASTSLQAAIKVCTLFMSFMSAL